MARRPKRQYRRRGNRGLGFRNRTYIKGDISHTLVLDGLAAATLLGSVISETVSEKSLVSSIDCSYSFADVLNDGDGPYLFGVAHSDYTDAEIEAVIENTGSWNKGDKISQEIGKRLVRRIGTWSADQAATANTGDYRWNEGRPVKTKLNWSLQTGATLKFWVYNLGSAAISTADLKANGHANLWQ